MHQLTGVHFVILTLLLEQSTCSVTPFLLRGYSLYGVCSRRYISMGWEVEGTDEFTDWFMGLTRSESDAVARAVGLLERFGPALGDPYTSDVVSSRHKRMRELKAQHRGHPLRMLYAFDPRRTAIILLGGDKTGDDRWYDVNVPRADRLYDVHRDELKQEGLI
ncbi:MAG TPA: type II toxin-antitoxin system RelE/ParE family toxin [Longimicrobium sp.]|nr:type II toxin-antitoxin system RelE/ParE family toxin [Longimicrobium sp.]